VYFENFAFDVSNYKALESSIFSGLFVLFHLFKSICLVAIATLK